MIKKYLNKIQKKIEKHIYLILRKKKKNNNLYLR